MATMASRLTIITSLLLVFVIVAGTSGIATVCPDGYYRCGTDLCCPGRG
jgi:hypothetical protein